MATKKTETEAKPTSKKEETIDLESLVKKQQEQMAEMAKQLAELKSNPVQNVTVVQDKGVTAKRIKVVSCIHCFLNLTTEEGGRGTPYRFPYFGFVNNIRYDDLEKCVQSHRRSAERGDFYICDPDAVTELNLTDAYQNLYNADEIDGIIHFKSGKLDIDRIVGMAIKDPYTGKINDTTTRDNAVQQIAENIAKGEAYDMNYVLELGTRLDVDMSDMIEKAKAVFEKDK